MNYLTWIYWFNSRPEPLQWETKRLLLGLCVILTIIGIASILGLLKKLGIPRIISERLRNFCFANLIIGLVLAFFNYELIPYFRSRYWYVIWFIIAALWLFNIIKQKPKHTQTFTNSREDEIKKYLP